VWVDVRKIYQPYRNSCVPHWKNGVTFPSNIVVGMIRYNKGVSSSYKNGIKCYGNKWKHVFEVTKQLVHVYPCVLRYIE